MHEIADAKGVLFSVIEGLNKQQLIAEIAWQELKWEEAAKKQ